jgi:hypothetical protein
MRIVIASLPSYYYIAAILALLIGWWSVIRVRRTIGVWRLRYFALPRPWLKVLHAHVPLYGHLPWELRAPYQDKVLQFVDAKGFRACGALDEVTEEMRVIIAGNACLLLLNGSGEENFPGVLTVQLFPAGDPDAAPRSSCVAMHWDENKQQASDPRDVGNASLPAIALKLGWEAGGQPSLPDTLLLTAWARVRSAEFIKRFPGVLEKAAGTAVHHGGPAPMLAARLGKAAVDAADSGGITESPEPDSQALNIYDPADIFAVATEMFLGASALLRDRQPELYGAMRLFYQVDPARWTAQQ